MNDIIRDLNDASAASISSNSAGDPTDCPVDSPFNGSYKILIKSIINVGTLISASPKDEYAYVAGGDIEIHSFATESQYIGNYLISFVVGLSTESDSELLSRTLVQTITMSIIRDEC